MRACLVLAALAFLLLSACVGMQGPIQLNASEVRQYQGQNLSSLADFQETSIKGTQYVNESTYRLNVTGLVDHPGSYTYDQVIDDHQGYSKVVRLDCVEGWSANILWQGVLVKDLLNEAGVQKDATTVIFHAYDGYTTSFPISYLEDNDIIMAYKMNNVTLPAQAGFPFILVAESKWGYKWIMWIDEIEVSNDASYEGYWESRGYSDSGDLNQSFVK